MKLKINLAFEKFIKKYNRSNEKIKRKYIHSYRTAALTYKIAKSLKLSKEQKEMAYLMGLLHDLGRFEQAIKYDTFNDLQSLDHGDFGSELLFEKGLIREFISDTKYDNILCKAIKYHNKFAIGEECNKDEILFSKIIRDADKLDIFNILATKKICRDPANNEISNYVKTAIENKSLAMYTKNYNGKDLLYINLLFVYDLNFKFSINYLSRKKYFEKLLKIYKITDEKYAKIIKKDFYQKVKEVNKC